MAHRRRGVLLGFAIALAAALSGCAAELPKTAPAQGKIVIEKGKPLANATVQFIPISETASFIANGTTDAGGAFQMHTYFNSRRVTQEGAVPGKYKVVVTPYPRGQRIASQYGSLKKTPLTVDIPESGTTNLTLKVTDGS